MSENWLIKYMVNILNKDSRLEKKNYLSNLNNFISISCITNHIQWIMINQSLLACGTMTIINNQKNKKYLFFK